MNFIMRSFSLFDFLRKFRRFWFSGEESHESDASPAALRTSAKVAEHAQDESAASRLACMGKMRCFSMDKKKLAHRGSLGKQVTPHPSERKPAFRMPGAMGGRNKLRDFPAAEAMAAPPLSAGTKAAIGGIRLNPVAAPPRRETNEVSLWKRRRQAEVPRLQID